MSNEPAFTFILPGLIMIGSIMLMILLVGLLLPGPWGNAVRKGTGLSALAVLATCLMILYEVVWKPFFHNYN